MTRSSITMFAVLLFSVMASVSQQVPQARNSKSDTNSIQPLARISQTENRFDARVDPISRAFRSHSTSGVEESDDVCPKGQVCCKIDDRAPECMSHNDCGYYEGKIVSDDKCK